VDKPLVPVINPLSKQAVVGFWLTVPDFQHFGETFCFLVLDKLNLMWLLLNSSRVHASCLSTYMFIRCSFISLSTDLSALQSVHKAILQHQCCAHTLYATHLQLPSEAPTNPFVFDFPAIPLFTANHTCRIQFILPNSRKHEFFYYTKRNTKLI